MTTYLFKNIEMKMYFLVDLNEDPKTKYMQQETVPNVHTAKSVARCDKTESICDLCWNTILHCISCNNWSMS